MVHTIKGTAAGETLTGTTGDDNIYGYAGNDIIVDDKGNDWLFGGDGNDTLTAGSGTNDYWGGTGNDTIKLVTRVGASYNDDLVHDFTQGADKIDVSAWGISDLGQIQDLLYFDSHHDATFNAFYNGRDHVMRLANISHLNATDFVFAATGPASQTGTAYADVLFGSAGDNALNGGEGDDILLGGAGNDTLIGGFGLDDYDGGAGTDTVSYAYSTDERVTINLATGITTFSDGAKEYLLSIENAVGSQVADTLIGTTGNNRLDGQAGADKITGGLGADTLVGGAGNDIFVYNAIADSPTATRDLITDFTPGDHIDLRGRESAAHQALHFIGGAAFSHHAGELQVVAGANTAVNIDVDGNGTAEFSIALTGNHPLGVSDFFL